MTGVANAPGCDPNQPRLETAGAPAVTSNSSIASNHTATQSNLLSQSSSSNSIFSSGLSPTYAGNGSSGFTARNINPYTSTAGAPGLGSASSEASSSAFSALPGSNTSLSIQASQTIYVNRNPFGCSEIM